MPYAQASDLGERPATWSPALVAGGFVLAALAGFVNASLLSFYDVPVSHMSGAATRLGIDLGTGQSDELLRLAGILGSFFAGAVVSGCIIGRHRLQPGRRYGAVLLIEAASLALAGWLLATGSAGSLGAAAFACGLQNAMASSYYGLIIRTTHMTGIVTDLGAMLGTLLRHRRGDPWKFVLLGAILAGFVLGALASALIGAEAGINRLYLAAGFAVAIAAGHRLQHARPPHTGAEDGR